MKPLLYTIVAICCPLIVFCQDITGLWKGTMYNDSTKQSLPYEIYISKTNGKYTGYTYTWFQINEKKYYGIKKVKASIAKDGKIVIQDLELIDHNYPVAPDKNVIQLNVLDLANNGDEAILDGPFATRRTKEYRELTGRINVKKISVSALSESDLIAYIQKNGGDNNLAVAK